MNDYPKTILIGTWLVFGTFFLAGVFSLSYFVHDLLREKEIYSPEVQAFMEKFSHGTDSFGYKLAWLLSSLVGICCIIPVILQTKAYRKSTRRHRQETTA